MPIERPLFESTEETKPNTCGYEIPLAERMRPKKLDEYVGQSHLIASGKPLRLMLEAGNVPSCILYGPPGVGKTSFAYLMAETTGRALFEINAVSAKVSTLREMVEQATLSRIRSGGKSAIAFVDEIYHFNSQQQNVLLPSVEKGELILVGTTTENPWFEINKTLLSRLMVYTLTPLSLEETLILLKRALYDTERGLGRLEVEDGDGALMRIAHLAGGDGRQALARLDVSVTSLALGGGRLLTVQHVDETTGGATQRYDRSGDDHYAVISALIKSIRGSDPDAAIYWLARMLSSGDDLHFLSRRLCILASEDIGLADPTALILAESSAASCDRVGLPEAKIILGHLVIYLASAPKSNSAYLAINKAEAAVKSGDLMEVPAHLKNGSDKYQYPHDFRGHWVAQSYLSEARRFYYPVAIGAEGRIADRLKLYWKRYRPEGEDGA